MDPQKPIFGEYTVTLPDGTVVTKVFSEAVGWY